MKLQRNYELTLEVDTITHETIVIEPPFTLNFSITHATLASANTGTFKIYNLKDSVRRQIYHDIYDTITYRAIILKAGYGDDMPVIFKGNMRHAFSVRRGTEWHTEIEGFDGGIARLNGYSSISMPPQSSMRDIFLSMAKDMPNILGLNIGNIQGEPTRGYVAQGNSWDMITEALNNNSGYEAQAFIHNEQIYLLNLNEYVEGGIPLIDAEAGLLDTPQRMDTNMQCRILFEPHVEIGQKVEIKSRESIYNGQYKVIGVTHQGTISEAESGACVTTVNLYIGPDLLQIRNFLGIPYRYNTI